MPSFASSELVELVELELVELVALVEAEVALVTTLNVHPLPAVHWPGQRDGFQLR